MAGQGSNQVQETPAQKALAETAKARMADYEQRWLPVQKKLTSQVQQAGAEGSAQRRQAAGMTGANVEQAFGTAEDKLQARLSGTGALPGSSKANLAVAGLGLDKAQSKGLGLTGADQQMDDAYLRGLSAITAIGQGKQATADSGLVQQAQTSGAQARRDAELALQARMNNAELGAQAVGYGVQRYMNSGPNVPQADRSSFRTDDPYRNAGHFGGAEGE